jgi:(p)ppGpp synthase/HD superfamily hydrolase
VNHAAALARVEKLAAEHRLRGDFLAEVFAVASRAHEGQRRKDGAPYIVHPLRVAVCVVEELGKAEDDLVAAALLHDTVEDTPLTLGEVEKLAGPRVRGLVDLLTKPKLKDKAELDRIYFARLREGDPGASVVKCADRIDNLRDMERSGWSQEKKRAYVAEARQKILPVAREKAPDAALVLERVADEVSGRL